MLQSLSIKNFVLIRDINVDFSPCFNVFTGETGAGKSLLIDALNFVSGQRSNGTIIGNSDTFTRVEATFVFPDSHVIFSVLKELGLECEDNTLIFTREIHQDGKNIMRLNHRSITLTMTRNLMESILDIHSQHETQYLLNKKNHLQLLDSFARNSDIRKEYIDLYNHYLALEKKLLAFESSDINPLEIKEIKSECLRIDQLNPSESDYTNTLLYIKEMSDFEKRKQLYEKIEILLDGNSGAVNTMFEGLSLASDLPGPLQELFSDVYYRVEDLRDEVTKANSELQFDPYEFDAMQNRVYEYQLLLRKHENVSDLIEYRHQLEERIKQSENYDDYRTDILNERNDALNNCISKSNELSKTRIKAAESLEQLIIKELNDLMLPNALFEIDIASKDLSLTGQDDVVFKVSMNKGSVASPLSQVASGGELSRLMLGLKVVFSELFGISTLIFDEIDTGVSGRVGLEMGLKMSKLARTAQVITISHLASVASVADDHYHISKANSKDETITSISKLNDDQRIHELALIMAGDINEDSIKAATTLFHESQERRWQK